MFEAISGPNRISQVALAVRLGVSRSVVTERIRQSRDAEEKHVMRTLIAPTGTGRTVTYSRNNGRADFTDDGGTPLALMKRPGLTAALDALGMGDTLHVLGGLARLTRSADQLDMLVYFLRVKGVGLVVDED